MEKKPILLYFYLSSSSFVLQDLTTVQETFHVKKFHFNVDIKLLLPLSFLRQSYFLIRNIFSASLLMCQFGGYHSLLPVLFGKLFQRKCIIVVGGTDCTSMPSINYGNLRKPLLRWFTLRSLKFSDHIISPSISLIECDYTYSEIDFPKQGYRYFDRSITTPFSVIFNGVDLSRFKPVESSVRRRNSFLTICSKIDQRNFKLKGLDLFTLAARYFPDSEFTIIGRVASDFNFSQPDNVRIVDYVPHEVLPEIIGGFTYYCQLSLSEGFGLALAEAMACCCVPIVSKVGIMDFIAGETGFILEKNEIGLLIKIISEALESDVESLGIKARSRIINNFSSEIRRSALLKLLNNL